MARIFRITSYESSPVVLNDITFTNAGNCAIYSLNPNLIVKNCTFENNFGTDYGGAIAITPQGTNTQIIDSTFRNNRAVNEGGAIHTAGANLNISGSTFENNTANVGGAINIGAQNCIVSDSTFENNSATTCGGAVNIANGAENSQIRNSNFTNNKANFTIDNARGGAAIFVDSDLTNISDCIFKENNAAHTGGAIFVHAKKNVKINNSTFINNTAFTEAGAVYLFYCENCTVGYCNFTQNRATCPNGDSYGGAIRVHEGTNTYIHDSNFTGNYVNHNAGGAIEYHSDGLSNGTIENCNFESNTANSDGGAIYAHCKGELDIIGCNFTNNAVIDNQNVKSGGAVLINLKKEDNGTVVWNNALKTNILNSNFINNTAPVMGGALCLRSNVKGITFEDNIIENCTFTGNNATWGSAIFLYTGVSANLTNVVFGKNRANSTSLDISVDKKKSVYPSNITLTVIFQGKDNIVNAIWNGGHHSKDDRTQQNPSHVYLKNITYEVYHDGELKTVQVYQDELEIL